MRTAITEARNETHEACLALQASLAELLPLEVEPERAAVLERLRVALVAASGVSSNQPDQRA